MNGSPLNPDDHVFHDASPVDYRHNAVVWSTSTIHWPYGTGFRMAADALVERAIREHEQDLLLFPILYCYRHAIELAMKEILYLDQRAGHAQRETVRTHDLRKLWGWTEPALRRAGGEPDDKVFVTIGRLIGELADVDPAAEQFRYDRDNHGRGRDVPEALLRVDVLNVHRVLGEVLDYLSNHIDYIDDLMQNMPDY